MVMRGGGRNREIQRLQAAAAQNGGEGTARQAQRLEYLRNHPQAGRRPQGPQTGGPLQEAMGAGGQAIMEAMGPGGNYKDNIRMGPGGQDAMRLARDGANRAAGGNDLRMQQPYNGGNYKDGILDSMRGRGPGMSNGGTTWDGQAPMNPYGGGKPIQPGSDRGFPGLGGMSLDDYQRNVRDERPQDVRAGEALARGIRPPSGPQEQAQLDAYNAYKSSNPPPMQPGQLEDAARQVQQGFKPMQRPTPGNMPGQAPNMPPGFTTYPMQMSQEDLVKRYPPGTQIPGLQQFGPGAAVGKDPSVYAGNRGPDYFRGQGMDMGKFNQPGYQAPQRQVQGNQIAGGGTTMDRFSRPGYTAPQRNVAGDQIRGGGSPGLSRRRVNTDPNRRGQPAGVLAPIPR